MNTTLTLKNFDDHLQDWYDYVEPPVSSIYDSFPAIHKGCFLQDVVMHCLDALKGQLKKINDLQHALKFVCQRAWWFCLGQKKKTDKECEGVAIFQLQQSYYAIENEFPLEQQLLSILRELSPGQLLHIVKLVCTEAQYATLYLQYFGRKTIDEQTGHPIFDGCKMDEIAEILNADPSTVKSWAKRGKERLRKEFKENAMQYINGNFNHLN